MRIFDRIDPRNLDQRQWELWMLALTVISVLAAGMALLMYPSALSNDLIVSRTKLKILIGFCALSIPLMGYLLDRQVVINQLRARLGEERKGAEEAFRESEARFRAVFENAAIGIALVDMHGHPVESNPALQKMLGYNKLELAHMAFTEYTHPDDAQADWDLFTELVEGKRDQYRTRKALPAGRMGEVVWGKLTVSVVRNQNGEPQYCHRNGGGHIRAQADSGSPAAVVRPPASLAGRGTAARCSRTTRHHRAKLGGLGDQPERGERLGRGTESPSTRLSFRKPRIGRAVLA